MSGYTGPSKFNSALSSYSHSKSPMLRVESMDLALISEFNGWSFDSATIFTLAKDAVKYISFEVPAGSDRFVALQARDFKTTFADVEIEVLWDAGITGGTAIPIFNNHDALNAASIVDFKDAPTIDETGSRVRELDFIPEGAGNNKSGGQIGANASFRIYRAGESFVVKITNSNTSANKIKLGYSWLEPPLSIINAE